MNIIQAVKSNRPFRRKSWANGRWVSVANISSGTDGMIVLDSDLVADDWEVEEEKISLTLNDVLTAIQDADACRPYAHSCDYSRTCDWREIFLSKLGFKG